MSRLILRRLLLIPFALVLINFAGFAYATLARQVNQASNPFGTGQEGLPPVGAPYLAYARGLLHFDPGSMPSGTGKGLGRVLFDASIASLGLLLLSFTLSLVIGLILGLTAGGRRPESRRVSPWLLPITTLGLAMPGFYVGTLAVVAALMYVIRAGPDAESPLPLLGFGWDLHLVLPALALMIRPTVQIAQVTANRLTSELVKPYITVALSRGFSWRRVRWKHALSNVLAPVILTMAGSFRLLVAELVLVEQLFNWPGLGRLLVATLVLPQFASPGNIDETAYFLHPPMMAAVLTLFALLFLAVDTLASVVVRAVDPRLRAEEG